MRAVVEEGERTPVNSEEGWVEEEKEVLMGGEGGGRWRRGEKG